MLHGCLTQPNVPRLELKLLTHKTLHPNQESSTKDLDLTKSGWGELKRLLKSYANGQGPAAHARGGGVPFIGNRKTSHWSYQSKLVRPVHHIGQTGRVTPNSIRAIPKGNSPNWQIWFRTLTCLENGRTSSVEFKFQRSNSPPDMSGPRLDMSGKSL
jgi:hypothetical protein